MTENEFQQIWKDTRAALSGIVKNASPQSKVLTRDAFDREESVWIGRLKNSSGKVDCWTVSYTGTETIDDAGANATDVYRLSFKMVFYYRHDFGTNVSNSEEEFTDILNALRYALRDNRTLGVSFVADHSGFNERTILSKIDTQNVHIARADFHVYLCDLPYTYS